MRSELTQYLPPIEGGCPRCKGSLLYELDAEIGIYDLKCISCGRCLSSISTYELRRRSGEGNLQCCRYCMFWHEYYVDQCSVNGVDTEASDCCNRFQSWENKHV